MADQGGVAGQRPEPSASFSLVGELAEQKPAKFIPTKDENLYRNLLKVGLAEYPIEARGEIADRLAGELPGTLIEAMGTLKVFKWQTSARQERRDVRIVIESYSVHE